MIITDLLLRPVGWAAIATAATDGERDDIAFHQIERVLRFQVDNLAAALDLAITGRPPRSAEQAVGGATKAVAIKRYPHIVLEDFVPSQETKAATQLAATTAIGAQTIFEHPKKREILVERFDRRVRAIGQWSVDCVTSVIVDPGTIAAAENLQVHRPAGSILQMGKHTDRGGI